MYRSKPLLIWTLLTLALLITLTACQSSPTPDPATEVVPTQTQAPTETQEPVYQVVATNAIDPSVSLEWIKNPMWEPLYDFPLAADFTLIIPPGFVISYEYGKTGSENFLYLVYVAPEGIIKVHVDALIDFGSEVVKSVKDMSDEEMRGFLDAFDTFFQTAKETGFVQYRLSSNGTTLGQIAIGSEEGSENCLMYWDLAEHAGDLCAFDPDKTTLSYPESIEALISAFTPIGDLSLEELINGEYEVYVLDDNSNLFFQFSGSGEGSPSTW